MTQTICCPKEDLRQKRTRHLLVQALVALLEERSFSSLSVVDICQRAMVHRTTFYAHFEDKQALLRYAIESILQKFEILAASPSLSPHNFFLAVAHSALVFLSQHRSLFQVGLGTQAPLRRSGAGVHAVSAHGPASDPALVSSCFGRSES